MWTDLSFPADKNSIGTSRASEYKERNWDDYEWKRSLEISDSNPVDLYSGGVDMNDVSQGPLGNYCLISALGALALVPKRVENLFRNHKSNDQGIYCLTLYINGEK